MRRCERVIIFGKVGDSAEVFVVFVVVVFNLCNIGITQCYRSPGTKKLFAL